MNDQDENRQTIGRARITRRSLLTHASSAAILGSAASLTAPFIRNATADEPLKLGLILAKQGPFAQQGSDLAAGAQMALKEANDTVMGRKIEVTWLDESDPQSATQSITKLAQEKVTAILGGTSSANTLAMGAVAKRERLPFISLNAVAREVTGKQCNRFMFRGPASVPVYARAMGPDLLAAGKKWYFLVANYAMGDDVHSSFAELLKASGGTVAGVDRVPVEATDISSYILKVRQAKPDVLISGLPNVGPILKQLHEFGMTGNITVGGPAVSDTDLWSVPREALSGIYGKTWYYNDPLNSAEDKAFTAAYLKETKKPPTDRVWAGWFMARFLLAALENAKSTDPAKVVGALETLHFKDGSQRTSFRDWDHQLIRRPVVGVAKPNPNDNWDTLKVTSTAPMEKPALEALFGTKEEIGCNMEAQ
jgi:branched-chain amino acid transport system substrate-binding protein